MKGKEHSLTITGARPIRSRTVAAERDDIADRLALRRDILDLIYRRRANEGDPNIGASIELQILRFPTCTEEAGSKQ